MTIVVILVAGVVIFVLAFLYFVFSEQQLETEQGLIMGDTAEANLVLELPENRFELELNTRQPITAQDVVDEPPPEGDDTFDFSEADFHLESKTIQPSATERTIVRNLQIEFARKIYIHQPFNLNVHLLGLTTEPLQSTPETVVTPTKALQFMAAEPSPKLEITLSYTEGDFRIPSAQKVCQLSSQQESVSFLVIPQKSGTLPLTVTICYLKSSTIPERLREKTISIKKVDGDSQETTETHIFDPEIKKTDPIPIYSKDLAIKTTSIWGISDAQVRFWQKALAPVLVVILLIAGFLFGQLSIEQAIVMLVVGVADIAGIAVFPDLQKALLK